MSHRATNWAIQQRGLPPATKLVLWHLCDRHNPDYGCFPSQDQLAADVEISRASLNTHLDRLERAGLIRRERRLDDSHRQKSTRYFLGFEADFPGGDDPPRPRKSHVQILDTGPMSSRVQILDMGSRVQFLDTETRKSRVQILDMAPPSRVQIWPKAVSRFWTRTL